MLDILVFINSVSEYDFILGELPPEAKQPQHALRHVRLMKEEEEGGGVNEKKNMNR